MGKAILKEMTLKLPIGVIGTVQNREIITMLLDRALSKAEYYLSRCNEMEGKYGLDFTSFKNQVNKKKKETFAEWDDFILWEGYTLASKEWHQKYEALKSCMK